MDSVFLLNILVYSQFIRRRDLVTAPSLSRYTHPLQGRPITPSSRL
jgi:hypothetical protein